MFYDESVLLTIASAIGKPVKVDLNTLNMTRGRFPRVCVEINLNEPVVGRFFLNGVWYNVEYEGLHLLCSSCGCYGHVLRNCPHIARPVPTTNGVGEKEVVEQPSREAMCNADYVAQSGEQSTLHARGTITPDPHGEWLIVKRKNRKHNLGKPLSKGRSSSHYGTAENKEKIQALPSYPTRGIHIEAESREVFKNPRAVTGTPSEREQDHARVNQRAVKVNPSECEQDHARVNQRAVKGNTRESERERERERVDIGHVTPVNQNEMSSSKDTKKRSRVEDIGARPRPTLDGGLMLSDGILHKGRSSQESPPLGSSRDVHEGLTGNLHMGLASSALQTGCKTLVLHESEDSGQDILGTEDVMKYDQLLEEEAMMM
uniref:CCHC-type domain-containing protein n=1 Tax=Cajanus cajan TaxID=3821 RepID=A0A151T1Y1_CAJCA|nr:hypothetical protein KK1_023487 [Cajanus cajan]